MHFYWMCSSRSRSIPYYLQSIESYVEWNTFSYHIITLWQRVTLAWLLLLLLVLLPFLMIYSPVYYMHMQLLFLDLHNEHANARQRVTCLELCNIFLFSLSFCFGFFILFLDLFPRLIMHTTFIIFIHLMLQAIVSRLRSCFSLAISSNRENE